MEPTFRTQDSNFPKPKYSKEFLELVGDQERLRHLLKNNDIEMGISGHATSDQLIEGWAQERSLGADFINKNGTILDFGCANGFLLRCFQEWSKYKLDPYGMDANGERIREAREVVYPNLANHFVDNTKTPPLDFPKTFDFIYWNIWDNYIEELDNTDVDNLFPKVWQALSPGGRIIFGFYNDSKEANLAGVKKLEANLKLSFDQIYTNSLDRVVVFIDKPKE